MCTATLLATTFAPRWWSFELYSGLEMLGAVLAACCGLQSGRRLALGAPRRAGDAWLWDRACSGTLHLVICAWLLGLVGVLLPGAARWGYRGLLPVEAAAYLTLIASRGFLRMHPKRHDPIDAEAPRVLALVFAAQVVHLGLWEVGRAQALIAGWLCGVLYAWAMLRIAAAGFSGGRLAAALEMPRPRAERRPGARSSWRTAA